MSNKSREGMVHITAGNDSGWVPVATARHMIQNGNAVETTPGGKETEPVTKQQATAKKNDVPAAS